MSRLSSLELWSYYLGVERTGGRPLLLSRTLYQRPLYPRRIPRSRGNSLLSPGSRCLPACLTHAHTTTNGKSLKSRQFDGYQNNDSVRSHCGRYHCGRSHCGRSHCGRYHCGRYHCGRFICSRHFLRKFSQDVLLESGSPARVNQYILRRGEMVPSARVIRSFP